MTDDTVPLDDLRYGLPDPRTLRPYLSGPLYIGELYDTDPQSTQAVGIPIDRQRRHIAHIAAAGTGKTVTLQQAVHTNSRATEGIDIVIDPKGGFTDGFLPLVYHDSGHLEDVTVINAATEMLRIPLFDLRPFIEADLPISRSRVIDIVVEAGMEVLASVATTEESFESAGQSVELIRTLLTASFRAGADTVSLSDLLARLSDVQAGTLSLAVDDPLLNRYLDATTDDDKRTLRHIVGGARRRLSPLIRDNLFADAFGRIPENPRDQFNVVEALDRDAVVIIDTAGLDATQRAQIIRLITARVFAAGRLRQLDRDTSSHSLANLYLDEAHVLGESDVLLDLLAEGRAFDISLYLLSQQLDQFGEQAQAHIARNVGTVLTAQADTAMAHAIASGPYDNRQAEHLVGRIPAGDWLVRVRPHRDHAVPDPFLISAGTLPETHPESSAYDDLPADVRADCEAAVAACRERSRARNDVAVAAMGESATAQHEDVARGLSHTLWLPDNTLPDGAVYDETADQVHCADCGAAFLPRFENVCQALRHCRTDVDLGALDIPIIDIGLERVSTDAVQLCPLEIREVMLLRLIERARRRSIDNRAWDIRDETMMPLRETVHLTGSEPKERLSEKGYLTVQDDLVGDYYKLTREARTLLRQLRDGADPPEPKRGDPAESCMHIQGVERAATALETLTDEPTVPIAQVRRYWQPPDSDSVIDVAGLDADGTPRVCVEVERWTHDISAGVLHDADAIADCDPDAAVWVVTNRELGHAVVDALVTPTTGQPRIDMDPTEVYGPTTPLHRYDLSSPACSALATYGQVDTDTFRDALDTGSGTHE